MLVEPENWQETERTDSYQKGTEVDESAAMLVIRSQFRANFIERQQTHREKWSPLWNLSGTANQIEFPSDRKLLSREIEKNFLDLTGHSFRYDGNLFSIRRDFCVCS